MESDLSTSVDKTGKEKKPILNLKLFSDLSFSGNITHHSAIQWSQGNKIALCTDKGIYILSSHCLPSYSCPLPLHKQFIPAPTESQVFDTKINREDLETYLERDDLFNLMLDHTLSPQTSNSALFQTFRRAIWSPAGAAGYKQCLLATLSMDHRLLIYSEVDSKWVVVCDLSRTFYEECLTTKWSNVRLDKINTAAKASSAFKIFKDRLYTLAAVEIVWTHMFGVDVSSTGQWCYLIVATKNGHLMFWRVCIQQETKARMVFHLKSDAISLIRSLHWQPVGPSAGLLILGCISGEVLVLPVSENMADRGAGLSISEAKVLWKDKDRIIPSCLSVLKQSKESYYIICTKGQFLVLAQATLQKNDLRIQKISYYTGQFSLPATGVSVLEKSLPQKSFILTSQDGGVMKIRINTTEDNPKFTVTQEAIQLVNDDVRLVPQGVTASPNYVMQAVIFNIGAMYDHLVIKDPLRVMLFSLGSVNEMTKELLRHTRGIVLVPLCAAFGDLLDCLRGQLTPSSPVPEPFLQLISSNYPAQSISALQLIRYVIKAKLAGTMNFDQDPEVLAKKIEEIDVLIMQKHTMNICQSAMTRMETLSLQQRSSFGLMTQWLQNTFDICLTEVDPDVTMETPVTQEQCRICGLTIPLNNIHKGSCEKGHQFARCCLSLLICNTAFYLKCNCCNAFALKENVWTLKLNCLFCGMFLQ